MSSSDIYSALNPSAFFMMQRRQRLIREALARFAERSGKRLSETTILEIGCGKGQWLPEFQMFGFRTENYAGIDIVRKDVEDAEKRFPKADFKPGDAAELPWKDKSFDIVFQSTVFTSILDPETKRKAAAEMKRVCAEDGMILWYDFAFDNPKNPDVKGVGKREIRALFEPWECRFRRVTLAPPIARRVVPLSWSLAEALETLCPPLRTHLLVETTPPEK